MDVTPQISYLDAQIERARAQVTGCAALLIAAVGIMRFGGGEHDPLLVWSAALSVMAAGFRAVCGSLVVMRYRAIKMHVTRSALIQAIGEGAQRPVRDPLERVLGWKFFGQADFVDKMLSNIFGFWPDGHQPQDQKEGQLTITMLEAQVAGARLRAISGLVVGVMGMALLLVGKVWSWL